MKNTREDNVAKISLIRFLTWIIPEDKPQIFIAFLSNPLAFIWIGFSFSSMLASASVLNLINYNDLVPLGRRSVKHASALLLFARSYPPPESPCNPGLSLSLQKSLFRAKALALCVFDAKHTNVFFSIHHHLNTVCPMIKQHWVKAGSPPSVSWSTV